MVFEGLLTTALNFLLSVERDWVLVDIGGASLVPEASFCRLVVRDGFHNDSSQGDDVTKSQDDEARVTQHITLEEEIERLTPVLLTVGIGLNSVRYLHAHRLQFAQNDQTSNSNR